MRPTFLDAAFEGRVTEPDSVVVGDDLLEQLYVVRRLPPWFRNPLKRLAKTPKLHFLDSGLLAGTLGITAERIRKDRALVGPLLESFVFSEIVRQAGWSEDPLTLHHFRDRDQHEADIVIEAGTGGLVAIEVKASATGSGGAHH